jgi:hypothetical protein
VKIVTAGKPAVGLARTIAKSNPAFRGKVAPILNELAAMTAQARSGKGAEEGGEEGDEGDLDGEGDAPEPKPDA